MFQLTTPELKLLLRLKHSNNYDPTANLRSQAKETRPIKRQVYKQLHQKGLIDYEEIVTRFGLTATGRVLLSLDISVWPITPDERYVLKSCGNRSIHPAQICPRVPQNLRQSLIRGLAQQGFLRITQTAFDDVRLTLAGQDYLLSGYSDEASRQCSPVPPQKPW